MTEQPAEGGGGDAAGPVQSFLDAIQTTLNESATAFSGKLAESLTAQMGDLTKQFQAAHPAIAQTNSVVVGFSTTVAQSTGAVGQAAANVTSMIENTRKMRTEITTTLTRLRQLPIVQRLIAVSTKLWAAAQRVLNVVMRLNPIGLIITAITVLVAAFVLAYQRSTVFRTIVQTAFNAIRNVVMTAFTVIRNAVMVVWPFIQRVIQVAVTIIRTYITVYFTIIRVLITTVWNVIRTVITVAWRGIVTAVRTYITVVRTVITTVFNAVRAVVSAVWNGVRSFITGAVRRIVAVVGGVRRVYTIIRSAFNSARSAVSSAIGGVVQFVASLPRRAVSALGNIGKTLVSAGRNLIEGFINGIRSAAGRIVSAIKDFVLSKIPGPIKSALGISSPSRLMAGLGYSIGEGLAVGIGQSGGLVEDAMRRLVPVPRTAAVEAPAIGLAREAIKTAALRGVSVAAGQAARTGRPVTVNVYPQRGQSEYEIGRVAARELAWAAKR